MTKEPTCGTCRHWHIRPTDPSNLGGPPTGECRLNPPALLGVPQHNRFTQEVGLQLIPQYPPLPEGFAACSWHEEGKEQP